MATFVPFRERENNFVPVVLKPSFSSIPCTMFPFLDHIDLEPDMIWNLVTKTQHNNKTLRLDPYQTMD
jgi:hypothetical protein